MIGFNISDFFGRISFEKVNLVGIRRMTVRRLSPPLKSVSGKVLKMNNKRLAKKSGVVVMKGGGKGK